MATRTLSSPRAPMPSPPARQYSFTDWQANNPTAPPPGDRMDAEYDRANTAVSQTITWASTSLNTDGTIRDGIIDQSNLVSGLFDDIAAGIIDDVQPMVDDAQGFANAAQASSLTAQAAATSASTANTAAQAAATSASTSASTATTRASAANSSAIAAQNAASDAGNAADDAAGDLALSEDYGLVTQAWAEHMPDPIPPNILAVMGVTGDHWSSRWWANQAAAIATGALNYRGAWNPVTNTPVLASGGLTGGIASKKGDYYLVSTTGTSVSIDGQTTWVAGDFVVSTGTVWQRAQIYYSGGPFVPTTNPITGLPGISAFPGTDPYQSPDSYALTGSMTIRGQPYGYYDTGTLLSMVSTTLPLSSSRAGVSGGFEAGVPAMAAHSYTDIVTLYTGNGPSPPPLVLHSVTYDATHVYPHPNLTAAQIARLRKNMWVMTNSIDTTVSTTPAVPNGWPPERHYASYVTGWAVDGSSISVVGWTVPGSGHTAAGQVPPVGTLDPGALNATVYFGSPTSHTGANLVLQCNPAIQPDDRASRYTGIEIDIQSWSTTDYAVYAAGIGIGFNPLNGAKPSADSWGMTLSGFPTGIIINYGDVGLNVQTAKYVLVSDAFNILNWHSPPVWAGSPATVLSWESGNYIDANVLRLQCWISRDTATPGWPGASLHLGMRVDGTMLTMIGGSPMAQLVWNPQSFQGGLQLQNQAGVAGITVDSNAWVYPRVVNAANDAAAAAASVPIGAMYRNGSVAMVRVA